MQFSYREATGTIRDCRLHWKLAVIIHTVDKTSGHSDSSRGFQNPTMVMTWPALLTLTDLAKRCFLRCPSMKELEKHLRHTRPPGGLESPRFHTVFQMSLKSPVGQPRVHISTNFNWNPFKTLCISHE